MKKRWFALGAAALALAAVVMRAPATRSCAQPGTVEDLVAACLATRATGWELTDAAITAVARCYPHYSLWHLWESPTRSLARHRGWSHQYNTVLLMVLRRLGFEARLVHAARVRGFGRPWWLSGHTWVKVCLDGREVDACASRETNRAGACGFIALTPELPLRHVTRWAVGLALVPFVVVEVWSAWIRGRAVATWVYEHKRLEVGP